MASASAAAAMATATARGTDGRDFTALASGLNCHGRSLLHQLSRTAGRTRRLLTTAYQNLIVGFTRFA